MVRSKGKGTLVTGVGLGMIGVTPVGLPVSKGLSELSESSEPQPETRRPASAVRTRGRRTRIEASEAKAAHDNRGSRIRQTATASKTAGIGRIMARSAAESLGDAVDEAIAHLAIGVEPLLAVAGDEARVGRRPIFDVGRHGAGQIEGTVVG